MVLQVAAYGRSVDPHLDPVLLQVICRSDAGQHQDLRTVECAGGQDNALARGQKRASAAPFHHDACHPAAFDQQALCQRAGANVDVGLVANRFDVSARGGPSLTVALRDLVKTEACLFLAIEVVIAGQLQPRRTLDEGLAGGVGVFLVGHE